MKKQLFLLVMILLPMVASADAVEIDGIYYNLIPKGNAAEVTSNPNKYSGDVVIENTIEYEGITYTVKSIGKFAFKKCGNLTSVTLPDSLKTIGEEAFFYCSSLTSIRVPKSVTSIEINAFSGSGVSSVYISDLVAWCNIEKTHCNFSITSLYLNDVEVKDLVIPHEVTFVGFGAFAGCIGITSVIIPNSVTSIGENAFFGCSSLTSVIIPNSVSTIDRSAFGQCTGLTSVNFFNGLTLIGHSAFYECSGLTSVSIPNSVSSIGADAFDFCNNLNSVVIGSGVTSIGAYAFARCEKIANVFCYAKKVPKTDIKTFLDSYPEYTTLHVPASSVDKYKAADPWKNFKEIVALTEDDPKPDATGFNVVENAKDNKTVIYDLNGVRQSELQKGINIINGKKYVKK